MLVVALFGTQVSSLCKIGSELWRSEWKIDFHGAMVLPAKSPHYGQIAVHDPGNPKIIFRDHQTFWKTPLGNSGKEKTNKHKHFGAGRCSGQTGPIPVANQDPSLDKPGPAPGTNRPVPVQFHRKIAILSRLSLGRGGGSSLGRLSRKGRQENVYVFCVYWFLSSPTLEK